MLRVHLRGVAHLVGDRVRWGEGQLGHTIRRVSYELAVDNFNEGVRYFEVRFAPQLHADLELADNGRSAFGRVPS